MRTYFHHRCLTDMPQNREHISYNGYPPLQRWEEGRWFIKNFSNGELSKVFIYIVGRDGKRSRSKNEGYHSENFETSN